MFDSTFVFHVCLAAVEKIEPKDYILQLQAFYAKMQTLLFVVTNGNDNTCNVKIQVFYIFHYGQWPHHCYVAN